MITREKLEVLTVSTAGTLNVEVGIVNNAGTAPNYYDGVRITGSAVLTGNLNIQPVGTPVANAPIYVYWDAVVTGLSETRKLYLFGQELPVPSASSKWWALVMYDGSKWLIFQTANWPTVDADFQLGQGQMVRGDTDGRQAPFNAGTDSYILIGQGGDVASKSLKGTLGINKEGSTWIANPLGPNDLGSGVVNNPSKRGATLNREVITSFVSFETDEIGDGYKIRIPYRADLRETHFSVIKELDPTDNGVITVKNDAGAVAGVQTINKGASQGSIWTKTNYSGNNQFSAGEFLRVECSKITAGGLVLASYVFERKDV